MSIVLEVIQHASAAEDGTLTHPLYLSLVSSQMETMSKMCLFKMGQYHLVLTKRKSMNICSEIFYFLGLKVSIVLEVFQHVPAAGDGTLTHPLYVSLASSQMETVSKMCLFKIGQY